MTSIAVVNQKGGSTKTVTATNLAAVWGQTRRVLLIDADPQFAATRHFGLRPVALAATLYDVLAEGLDASTAIVAGAAGVDVLAGDRRLATLELALVGETMRERFLAGALEGLSERYDIVLIDCPPNLGLLTVNALVAAERVIVPVRMEDEGALQGVIELRGTLASLTRRGLPRSIDAVIRTVVDSRRVVYQALDDGLGQAGFLPLTAEIPDRSAFHRQGVEGRPLALAQPDSAGALAYRRLASELESVLGMHAPKAGANK